MQEIIKRNLVRWLIFVLAFASFFTIYTTTQAGILFSVSDTLSREKIGVASNHEIAFTLNLATAVTENETIAISFSFGFDASLNGIDCGDVDLLDDAVQETLSTEIGGCTATATEWGATVAGGILTLTAPSNAGTYIAGSSDVIVRIGTNTTEGGVGNEQIVNPAIPGSYLIQIGGTFGDTKTFAIAIISDEQINVTATVGGGGGGGGGGSADRTPPIIFNLHIINITQTSATVTWETNEGATSLVNYGLTSFYGDSLYGVSFATTHSVNLTGLSPDTLYHAQAVSADFLGNIAYSEDQTFRTLAGPDITPPIISNIQVIDITQTSGTVTWQTNEAATSKVEYGLTTGYELGQVNLVDLVASHSVPLSGLTANMLYHFRVISVDASGNIVTSGDQTFIALRPAEIIPPVISNIRVINITENSGTVIWQTDEASTSRVRYGLTTAYELGNILLTDLVTSHSIPLSGLALNTVYHFEVYSTDVFGNTAVSGDYTFTTLPDTTPPANVANFTATPTVDKTIMLTWINPTDSDLAGVLIKRSFIGYPTSPADGDLVFNGLATSFEDTHFTPAAYNRPIYYTAFAYDMSANYASGAMAQAMIVVPVILDIKAWPEKRWPRTGNWSVSAKVDLRELSVPTVLQQTNVTTSDLGLASVEMDAPLRSYDIGFKGSSHLRKILRNVSLKAGTNSIDFTLGGTFHLLAGDVNRSQDNLVNSLDVSTLLSVLSTGNEISDLNRDGQVNSLDVNILLANLMKRGDQ